MILFSFFKRQIYDKGCPQTRLALYLDLSPHQCDQIAGNRHAKPCTTITLCDGSVCLFKRLEDTSDSLLCHTDPGIFKNETDHVGLVAFLISGNVQMDAAPRRGKFYCVGTEVHQDLIEPQRISDKYRIFSKPFHRLFKHDVFTFCLSINGGYKAVNDLKDIKRLILQSHLAAFYFRHVQHVVDQHQKVSGRKRDLRKTVLYSGRITDRRRRDRSHAYDGIQRHTDLVAHPGQELTLCRVGIFRCQHCLLQGLTRTDLFCAVRKYGDKLRGIHIFHPVDPHEHPALFLIGSGIFHQLFIRGSRLHSVIVLFENTGILFLQPLIQTFHIHHRDPKDPLQVESAVDDRPGIRIPNDKSVIDAQRQAVKKFTSVHQLFSLTVKDILGYEQHDYHQSHQQNRADQAGNPQCFSGGPISHLFLLRGGDDMLRLMDRLFIKGLEMLPCIGFDLLLCEPWLQTKFQIDVLFRLQKCQRAFQFLYVFCIAQI